jgi:hypothetical protein
VDESCAKIDAQDGLIDDYATLLDRILAYPRHEDVLRHDAKHRLLVERLRGDGNIRFSNARCWFLTQDTYLPRFAERMPDPDEAAPELPFCITPSAWLQVMRALTPRTEDYEQTIVDLLASPFVGYQRPVDQRTVREVVGRMEDQKDRSPELALAVLQDTALVHEITVARPRQVAEEVERAYSTKTRELQEQAAVAASRASEEQAKRERAEQRARDIERDRDNERGRREGLEGDLRREQEARTREQQELRQAIETAKQESQDAIDDERRRREELEARIAHTARRRRVLAALGAAGVAAIAAILVLVFGVVTGTWGTVAVITGALTVICLAARVGLGDKWGAEALGWVGAIAGILGTVVAIVFALAQK